MHAATRLLQTCSGLHHPGERRHAGTVKGLTSQQLEELGCHVILGNTYHLESRPGSQLVAGMGGLHGFVGWPRGMLTDSGGFQVRRPAHHLRTLCMCISLGRLTTQPTHCPPLTGPYLSPRKQPVQAEIHSEGGSTHNVCRCWQMVSLLHLAKVTEEGVQFQSPVDGALMMLTPEHSIAVQNRLGADADHA